MTVALHAVFTAREESQEVVARLVSDLVTQVRTESGNLTFEASVHRGEPRRWFIYEVYRDEEAFVAHLDSPHCHSFNVALADHIEGTGSELTFLEDPAILAS